jgi:hypothetical protein
MAVTAYVTTEARIKLYEYLCELGLSVLYALQTRIFCVHNVIEVPKVKKGIFLVTSLKSWRSLALTPISRKLYRVAKNNGFSVFSFSTEKRTRKYKEKGKILNYENSKDRNFSASRDIILQQITSVHAHKSRKIRWRHVIKGCRKHKKG